MARARFPKSRATIGLMGERKMQKPKLVLSISGMGVAHVSFAGGRDGSRNKVLRGFEKYIEPILTGLLIEIKLRRAIEGV